jgi:glycosyltransferase involved in cell wall biosynthesis
VLLRAERQSPLGVNGMRPNEFVPNGNGEAGSSAAVRSRQLDILFVISQLTVGGTENHLAMIAPALIQRGWRIALYSLYGDGPVSRALAAGGVEIIRPPVEFRTKRSLVSDVVPLALSSGQLLNVLIRRNPAIVHFFLPAAYLIGAPLAGLASTPLRIMSRRGLNVYQASHPWLSRFERRLHSSMTAVLGNSRSVVRELQDQEHVPLQKLGLIYNGLDLSRFTTLEARQQARGHLGLAPDGLLFVTIANLIPYKGHSDLLAALGQAKSRLPEKWRLLVVGRDDGIGTDLKHRAAALDIADHVDFMGSRSDIPRLLAAADIGLLCSHQEGFSNALLEGMAAGLPMIATTVGGNAEAVQDSLTGLLVPPKDPDRLAQALLRLAVDPGLRVRLGVAARERMFQHFSLDRCVESYDTLYRTLLAGRPASDVEPTRVERT